MAVTKKIVNLNRTKPEPKEEKEKHPVNDTVAHELKVEDSQEEKELKVIEPTQVVKDESKTTSTVELVVNEQSLVKETQTVPDEPLTNITLTSASAPVPVVNKTNEKGKYRFVISSLSS